jgi:alcohol dehydrogenase (cytochrome c)
VTAIDAETGAIRWKLQTPKPMVAGITATAGNVVFTGNLDGEVLALDAARGGIVWRRQAGGAIGGGVIAYEAAGKERVAAAVGLNSPIWPVQGGTARVVVYSITPRE